MTAGELVAGVFSKAPKHGFYCQRFVVVTVHTLYVLCPELAEVDSGQLDIQSTAP